MGSGEAVVEAVVEKQRLVESPSVIDTKTPKLWADVVPLSWKPFVQLSRLDLFAGSLMIWWPCSTFKLSFSPLTN